MPVSPKPKTQRLTLYAVKFRVHLHVIIRIEYVTIHIGGMRPELRSFRFHQPHFELTLLEHPEWKIFVYYCDLPGQDRY